MDDRLLVFRCKRGSREALRQIYDKYRDYLLILAVALSHDVHLAEDAVQDAFVTFVEKLEKFELRGSLKAYLATCVANRIRDLIRNRENKTVSLQTDCPVTSETDEPILDLICNERLEQLSSGLARLSHEQRETVALHIYGQMRFRAIARSLGISVNTVKGRYRYGINKLRSVLDDEVEK